MKRDEENAMIAGVCAGLAKEFKIDPVFVRAAFLSAFLFFGTGPLLYIILWFCMPVENN